MKNKEKSTVAQDIGDVRTVWVLSGRDDWSGANTVIGLYSYEVKAQQHRAVLEHANLAVTTPTGLAPPFDRLVQVKVKWRVEQVSIVENVPKPDESEAEEASEAPVVPPRATSYPSPVADAAELQDI